MKNSSRNCLIMCWNVLSVLNETKLENLLQILDDNHINIACISESWFDSKNGTFSAAIKKSGYKLHHAHREDKRGGGSAIMYKNHLMVKDGDASSSKYSSFEYSYVTLTLQSKIRLVLACIYRKQEISFSTFNEEFTTFMDKILYIGDAMLVVGDLNVWMDVVDDPDTRRLRTLMNAYGLSQLVQEPTHISGHTLDHIYVNEYQIELKYEVICDTLGLSTDHFPLVIEIPSANLQDTTQTIKYRKLKDIDLNKFKHDLQESYNSMEDSWHLDFITNFSKYEELSRIVMDKHAPIVTRKRKTCEVAWIDTEYRKNRAKRRRFERVWKKNRTDENRNNYIEQKRVCAETKLLLFKAC